jgi:hypothetical protein
MQCNPTTVPAADVRTLLLCLKSPEPSVQKSVCESLTEISDSKKCVIPFIKGVKLRQQILSSGVIGYLKPLLLSSDPSVKLASVQCLAAVTENIELTVDSRDPELLGSLVKLLDAAEPAEVQEEACFAVANLTTDCIICYIPLF